MPAFIFLFIAIGLWQVHTLQSAEAYEATHQNGLMLCSELKEYTKPSGDKPLNGRRPITLAPCSLADAARLEHMRTVAGTDYPHIPALFKPDHQSDTSLFLERIARTGSEEACYLIFESHFHDGFYSLYIARDAGTATSNSFIARRRHKRDT